MCMLKTLTEIIALEWETVSAEFKKRSRKDFKKKEGKI